MFFKLLPLSFALFLVLLSSCLPQTEKPVRFTLNEIETKLALSNQSLETLPFLKNNTIEKDLNLFYQNLVRKNEICGHYLEDRKSRVDIYCHEHCGSLHKKLIEHYKSQYDFNNQSIHSKYNPTFSVYTLRIFNTAKSPMINIQTNGIKRGYFFHVSTLIYESGEWGVFDPVVFGDSQLHSITEFLNSIEKPDLLSYNLFRAL